MNIENENANELLKSKVKKAWIKYYGGARIIEGSPEWDKLSKEYDSKKNNENFESDEFFKNRPDIDEEEVEWTSRFLYKTVYHESNQKMLDIIALSVPPTAAKDMILKMKFSYSVSVLESCLCDMRLC